MTIVAMVGRKNALNLGKISEVTTPEAETRHVTRSSIPALMTGFLL